jgi:ribosome-interacting GTPase 1
VTRPGCVEDVVVLHDVLAARKVRLTSHWDDPVADDDDPFLTVLPTALVAAKSDLDTDAAEDVAVLEELTGLEYPVLPVSAHSGAGLVELLDWLFDHLGIVRVYTKAPGQQSEDGRPYAVRRGATVHDVAMLVHRDLAHDLRYARVWSGGAFDGRQVGRDHVVGDGDVIELHT